MVSRHTKKYETEKYMKPLWKVRYIISNTVIWSARQPQIVTNKQGLTRDELLLYQQFQHHSIALKNTKVAYCWATTLC